MRRNLWSNDWCVRSNTRSGVSVISSFSRSHQLAMLELLKRNIIKLNTESMLGFESEQWKCARDEHQMLNRILWYEIALLDDRYMNCLQRTSLKLLDGWNRFRLCVCVCVCYSDVLVSVVFLLVI